MFPSVSATYIVPFVENVWLFTFVQLDVGFLLVTNVNPCVSTFGFAVTFTLLFVHVFGSTANSISFESIFGTVLVSISTSFDSFSFSFFPIAIALITNVVSCFNPVYVYSF